MFLSDKQSAYSFKDKKENEHEKNDLVERNPSDQPALASPKMLKVESNPSIQKADSEAPYELTKIDSTRKLNEQE